MPYVAIVEDSAGAAGFFPFQLGYMGVGHPIGGPLSDYQGVIARGDWHWDGEELIRSCGLNTWHFDHLLVAQKPFARFHRVEAQSPIIDLSHGYEAYLEERREAGTEQIKKAAYARRRLEREVGPVRIEFHVTDREVLQMLMKWKAGQYVESGKLNIFSVPWVVQVVEHIWQSQQENFAGMLSVLYAGDKPIAAHMGLRSQTVWHYWLPAYDPAFARYSPGILLLLGMAERAPALGLRVIDMGNGRALYKQRLTNGAIPIVEGEVAVSPLRSTVMSVRNLAENFVRHSPVLRPVRAVNTMIHEMNHNFQFFARVRSRVRFR